MAYAPPQKDVFGNWKQPKGKEVVLQDETPEKSETHEKSETPIKDETPVKDETPSKNETPTKDETPVKDETPSKNETPSVETPIKDETPTKDETPAIQPSQTEESWKTVREKPRKSRNSGTVEMEGRKKAPTLPKLNYKKIIQKSLKPAEPIPAVITGPIPPAAPATSASPASPASSAAQPAQAAPSSNPPNETPKTESKLINETPRTESKPSNETPSLTSFLSSLPPLQDTLPTDETPSQDYETPFHRFPAGSRVRFHGFHVFHGADGLGAVFFLGRRSERCGGRGDVRLERLGVLRSVRTPRFFLSFFLRRDVLLIGGVCDKQSKLGGSCWASSA